MAQAVQMGVVPVDHHDWFNNICDITEQTTFFSRKFVCQLNNWNLNTATRSVQCNHKCVVFMLLSQLPFIMQCCNLALCVDGAPHSILFYITTTSGTFHSWWKIPWPKTSLVTRTIVRHSSPRRSSPQTFITPYLFSDIHHLRHSSPPT